MGPQKCHCHFSSVTACELSDFEVSCVLCQAAVKLTARKEDETECVMAIFPGFQVTEARVSGPWLHLLKDRRV